MKRLALVLAAVSVLGTGCFVSDRAPCTGGVTVDWSSGFLGSDGVVRGCVAAEITWVDLFINNDVNTAARVACASLAASVVDLPSGQNLLTVEGVEADGRIAYRAERTVNGTCGDQQVPVTPAEGTLAVDYAFSPANVCYATQPTYIWVKVRDDIANQTAFVDSGTGGLNLCTTSGAAPTYRLPAGVYTLLGVNEVSLTLGIVGADCSHPQFTVTGAATTTVTPTLTDSAQACF